MKHPPAIVAKKIKERTGGYRCSRPRYVPRSRFLSSIRGRILPPRDAEGSSLPPRDFGGSANPYPRWIKQGTSGGPGAYVRGWEDRFARITNPQREGCAQPQTGVPARTEPSEGTKPASVRVLDYHGA